MTNDPRARLFLFQILDAGSCASVKEKMSASAEVRQIPKADRRVWIAPLCQRVLERAVLERQQDLEDEEDDWDEDMRLGPAMESMTAFLTDLDSPTPVDPVDSFFAPGGLGDPAPAPATAFPGPVAGAPAAQHDTSPPDTVAPSPIGWAAPKVPSAIAASWGAPVSSTASAKPPPDQPFTAAPSESTSGNGSFNSAAHAPDAAPPPPPPPTHALAGTQAKARAELYEVSQIRGLAIRCQIHQEGPDSNPRYCAAVAFGSRTAHSGTTWYDSRAQAEEAAAAELLTQIKATPRTQLHDDADRALRTAIQLSDPAGVQAALQVDAVKEHASMLLLAQANNMIRKPETSGQLPMATPPPAAALLSRPEQPFGSATATNGTQVAATPPAANGPTAAQQAAASQLQQLLAAAAGGQPPLAAGQPFALANQLGPGASLNAATFAAAATLLGQTQGTELKPEQLMAAAAAMQQAQQAQHHFHPGEAAGLRPPFPPPVVPNMRPGDWICPACSHHNYADKFKCNKCALPRVARDDTSEMRIPDGPCVNYIIGAKGATVHGLQAQTNTRISVQPQHEVQPGCPYRTVTISGTPEARAQAVILIQAKVDEHMGGHAAAAEARRVAEAEARARAAEMREARDAELRQQMLERQEAEVRAAALLEAEMERQEAAAAAAAAEAEAAAAAEAEMPRTRLVHFYKKGQGDRTGIRLGGAEGPPTVLALSAGGLGETVLSVGDKLLAINGQQLTGHDMATRLLRTGTGKISIEIELADDDDDWDEEEEEEEEEEPAGPSGLVILRETSPSPAPAAAPPVTEAPPRRESSRQSEPDADSARSLFVAKIPERVSEADLARYFGRLGLTTTHVKFLPQSGRHDTKSAFVDFSRAEDARRAHSTAHALAGSRLRTDYTRRGNTAAPQPPSEAPLGASRNSKRDDAAAAALTPSWQAALTSTNGGANGGGKPADSGSKGAEGGGKAENGGSKAADGGGKGAESGGGKGAEGGGKGADSASVVASGVRILKAVAPDSMMLSKFFGELYEKEGGAARELISAAGGAKGWLGKHDASFLLIPARKGTVGTEAVALAQKQRKGGADSVQATGKEKERGGSKQGEKASSEKASTKETKKEKENGAAAKEKEKEAQKEREKEKEKQKKKEKAKAKEQEQEQEKAAAAAGKEPREMQQALAMLENLHSRFGSDKDAWPLSKEALKEAAHCPGVGQNLYQLSRRGVVKVHDSASLRWDHAKIQLHVSGQPLGADDAQRKSPLPDWASFLE